MWAMKETTTTMRTMMMMTKMAKDGNWRIKKKKEKEGDGQIKKRTTINQLFTKTDNYSKKCSKIWGNIVYT